MADQPTRYSQVVAVTPSDTARLPFVADALLVLGTTAGTLTIMTWGGNKVEITGLVNTWPLEYHLAVSQVFATGTNVTTWALKA
jgi:hypothetical protein